ncbi:GATA transcription factor 21 [Heracleum sosnowskyi]|uniref:GATA transcription factor 21 n=1 Tax=Heracleum sosnowskyi TaxID=360622 RepID=A0AAD8GTC0_9APIA|nr:GATA transcription factor 21 [Heracleum sosnowskyi]
MTPAYLKFSTSSSTSADHVDPQAASSCSYLITRNFFDSATNQDQSEIYRQDIQQPQFQQDLANNYFSSSLGGSYDIENESSDNGLKFSIWGKEETNENQETIDYEIKWMSPKMRWMHKMKKDQQDSPKPIKTNTLIDTGDQKHQPSSMETENTSNTSSNSMISNPIRTCSDCNTTKTPLWRSGPQGPKSLCNACGIRQRKARRAMAAAAAAANDTAFEKETTPPLVIKTKKHNKIKTKTNQQKDKTSGRSVNVAKFKKRSCNLMVDGDHEAQKKVCLEDFLATLTNNLAYDQVFPQDEKDAAILLMAMSLHHARR